MGAKEARIAPHSCTTGVDTQRGSTMHATPRTRGGRKAAPASPVARGWESLPAELLELVASRLSFQQR